MKKEIWRHSWLESIHKLTSFKLQNNIIVNMGNGVSYWPFDILVNNYIDKVLFGFDYQYYTDEMNYLSSEEYEIIKDWHNELEDYILLIGDESDETVILRDRLLISFLQNGKLAKQKLLAVLPESEKQYLK
jgi:hypothetical protein